jgi:hypothetical protein
MKVQPKQDCGNVRIRENGILNNSADYGLSIRARFRVETDSEVPLTNPNKKCEHENQENRHEWCVSPAP